MNNTTLFGLIGTILLTYKITSVGHEYISEFAPYRSGVWKVHESLSEDFANMKTNKVDMSDEKKISKTLCEKMLAENQEDVCIFVCFNLLKQHFADYREKSEFTPDVDEIIAQKKVFVQGKRGHHH